MPARLERNAPYVVIIRPGNQTRLRVCSSGCTGNEAGEPQMSLGLDSRGIMVATTTSKESNHFRREE
jgi:hypothetical protein